MWKKRSNASKNLKRKILAGSGGVPAPRTGRGMEFVVVVDGCGAGSEGDSPVAWQHQQTEKASQPPVVINFITILCVHISIGM